MHTVIFIDTKGPAKLGTYNDKGDCRRGWKTCNQGAAILGPDGAVLECKSGTTAAAEKKLTAYAEHLRRQRGMAAEAAPARAPAPAATPDPSRGRVSIATVDVEVKEEDDEQDEDERDPDEEDELDEEPAPAPPPRLAPTVEPVPVAAPPPPAPVLKVGDVVAFPTGGPLGGGFAVVQALAGLTGAVVEFNFYGRMFAVDRDSITRDGDAWVCSTPFPDPPAAPKPAPVEHRLAEVTHAHHPATGAVVVGDDVERIAVVTHPACDAKDCKGPRGQNRANTNPVLRDLCQPHRKVAHDRSRAASVSLEEVVAHLRAGTLPPADPERAERGRKGGTAMKKAAAKRAAKVVARRDPKPAKVKLAPAAELAAALARARHHATLIEQLGGTEAAQELARFVEDLGGPEAFKGLLVDLTAFATRAA